MRCGLRPSTRHASPPGSIRQIVTASRSRRSGWPADSQMTYSGSSLKEQTHNWPSSSHILRRHTQDHKTKYLVTHHLNCSMGCSYIGSGRDDGDAMARQKCWWCRNWSCLRSGGTWLVHLMSVALALPLNRPAGFGIAGRQCNSLQYNGLLLFWPPPLVLVHYSTLHGWRKHWQCPFPHCAQIFILNQNEKLILDHIYRVKCNIQPILVGSQRLYYMYHKMK